MDFSPKVTDMRFEELSLSKGLTLSNFVYFVAVNLILLTSSMAVAEESTKDKKKRPRGNLGLITDLDDYEFCIENYIKDRNPVDGKLMAEAYAACPWYSPSDRNPTVGGPTGGVVLVTIRALLPSAKACYDSQLSRKKSARGKITIKFLIEGDGSISVLSMKRTGSIDLPLEQCVQKKFEDMIFPSMVRGLDISYPVVFDPPPKK